MKVYAAVEDPRMPLRDVPDLARRVERVGFDGLLVPEAVHDGFLTSLLALEHTSRLRVATSVALAFPRSPTVVAYAAWDLQSLSGGRFALGLGTQIKSNLEGRFGVPWMPPVPRMREYVQALRAIFEAWATGGKLDFAGKHYKLNRMQPFFAPPPIEHPDIPVFLGAVNPGMTRLCGEIANGVMTHPTNTNPRFLESVTIPGLEEGARRASRSRGDVSLVASCFVATGTTPEIVSSERERLREFLGFLYSTPQYWPTLKLLGCEDLGARLRDLSREGRWAEMKSAIGDDLFDQLIPSGTYGEIGGVLRAWYGGLADAITLRLPDDPNHDSVLAELLDELGNETA